MNATTDTTSPPLPLERPARDKLSGRLVSLDVFRGLVILSMLVVNNIGDHSVVGYFWRHPDWKTVPMGEGLAAWWKAPSFAGFPLFTSCTLADYVMPWFMLIIGVAIPFAWAARLAKGGGKAGGWYWAGVVRRGMTLYVLGWILGVSIQFLMWRFNPKAPPSPTFMLGMDVLQLLGVSYIVARVVYCLPTGPRLGVAAAMFVWHWAFLRFWPQGEVPAGTFTAKDNAVGYAYKTWAVFQSVEITGWLRFSIAGMLSVPPAAATMVVGTWVGEVLRDGRLSEGARIRRLVVVGGLMAAAGVAWAFDLPMNKPRWSPGYLVYCSGVGAVLIAVCYWVVDVRKWRWVGVGVWPVVALGVNAIGIYFLSILFKVWVLNMPKVTLANGSEVMFTSHLVSTLKAWTGSPAVGSWAFTAMFVGLVWAAACVAYWRRWIWKV